MSLPSRPPLAVGVLSLGLPLSTSGLPGLPKAPPPPPYMFNQAGRYPDYSVWLADRWAQPRPQEVPSTHLATPPLTLLVLSSSILHLNEVRCRIREFIGL